MQTDKKRVEEIFRSTIGNDRYFEVQDLETDGQWRIYYAGLVIDMLYPDRIFRLQIGEHGSGWLSSGDLIKFLNTEVPVP